MVSRNKVLSCCDMDFTLHSSGRVFVDIHPGGQSSGELRREEIPELIEWLKSFQSDRGDGSGDEKHG